MKHTKRRGLSKRAHISPLILLGVAAVSMFAGYRILTDTRASADCPSGATLSLSPGSGTATVGADQVVVVKLNTNGQPVNALQVNLKYPANFSGAAITPSGSFPIQAQNTAAGGSIKIARGTTEPVTGSVDVATIALHGASAGSADVQWDAGNAVVCSTANNNILANAAANSTAGTYTVQAAPTPPPPPGPTPNPTPNPTGTTSNKKNNTSTNTSNNSSSNDTAADTETPTDTSTATTDTATDTQESSDDSTAATSMTDDIVIAPPKEPLSDNVRLIAGFGLSGVALTAVVMAAILYWRRRVGFQADAHAAVLAGEFDSNQQVTDQEESTEDDVPTSLPVSTPTPGTVIQPGTVVNPPDNSTNPTDETPQ